MRQRQKRFRQNLIAGLLLSFSGWGSVWPVAPALAAPRPQIAINWSGSGISERVQKRVTALLHPIAELEHSNSPHAALHLKLRLISAPAAPPESFQLETQASAEPTWTISGPNRHSLLLGLYAALEKLGYRFWHPFAPHIPPRLNIPALTAESGKMQTPALPQRGFTHHTMHPLEMTHVLNGWGPEGSEDKAGWQKLLPEYEKYLEWLVAQRANEFEWVLLEKADWSEFARSPERQQRLKTLVDMAHAWGLHVGIDAPMALEQQNGWRLIRHPGPLKDELRELEHSLDWLAACGFDFVTTEMGLSEFHHEGDERMLQWLNHAVDYLDRRYSMKFNTKIHISHGQYSEHYQDPQTGGPLNYNFLPYYADPRLGVMPHTVQIYALDDPAPTYGWDDFSEMRRFMSFDSGRREQIWYPEDAYWVNYDIHVPLFLPVYAQRRLHDLWLLHGDGVKLNGQVIFSSGFEGGYWLNDVLAAHFAWNPHFEASQERDVLQQALSEELQPFGAAEPALTQLLLDTMEQEYRLLILGEVNGQRPSTIERRNGMAYLVGQDSWSQLAGMIRQMGLPGFQTQPERYSFSEVRHDTAKAEAFVHDVYPLLLAMERSFSELSRRAQALAPQIPTEQPDLLDYYHEMAAGLQMNAWRSREVRQLFEASLAGQYHDPRGRQRALQGARETLAAAGALMRERTRYFRADPERIAGWQRNPTAYSYGYLWPARSLYFWWRDYVQVESENDNPCLMNIIDPLRVVRPDPDPDWQASMARTVLPWLGLGDCVAPQKRWTPALGPEGVSN